MSIGLFHSSTFLNARIVKRCMILLLRAELIVKLNTLAVVFGQIITLIRVLKRSNQIVLRDKARKH